MRPLPEAPRPLRPTDSFGSPGVRVDAHALYRYGQTMTTPPPATKPPVPTWLSMRLDPETAELLHRTAYETGKSKRALVITAVRQTYGAGGMPATTQ